MYVEVPIAVLVERMAMGAHLIRVRIPLAHLHRAAHRRGVMKVTQ